MRNGGKLAVFSGATLGAKTWDTDSRDTTRGMRGRADDTLRGLFSAPQGSRSPRDGYARRRANARRARACGAHRAEPEYRLGEARSDRARRNPVRRRSRPRFDRRTGTRACDIQALRIPAALGQSG